MVSILRELDNSDVDWLLTTGHLLDVTANTFLVHPDQSLDMFYLLLSGELVVLLPTAAQPLPNATITHGTTLWAFTCLSAGDMAGVVPFPFIDGFLPYTTIQALSSARVLVLPKAALAQKLKEDSRFAAHFYRASALLLMQRFQRLSHQFKCSLAKFSQIPLREASTVFAELQDSDLDWLIAVGRIQQLTTGTTLIQAGRPVDELHLILEGAVSVHLIEIGTAPLFLPLLPDSSTASSPANSKANLAINSATNSGEQELARLSRGDLIGETLAINAFPTDVSVRIRRDAQVLSIPKWRLAAKLLHDPGFAARFYRVLTVLLANKQQAILQQLGYDGVNEMSNQLLTQVALAEARFEWMLKRIQAQISQAEVIQW